MRTWFSSPRARVVAAFILGVLTAAVILLPSATLAGRQITRAAVQSRASSCVAYDFHPADSDTWYDYTGVLVYHHVTDAHPGGSGFFVCDPKLPQSATVTKVQFTVYDNFNGDEVRNCGLVRTPLAGNVPESFQFLASVPRTGTNKTPGRIRLTDSSIAYATVDNTKFGYWLQCQVTAEPNTDQFTGLYGAQVYYLIDPAKG